jgi:pimeloyl-ACP methyl ester carboxylesterase
MAERPETTEVLRQLDVPILSVCGAEDQLSPPTEMRGLATMARYGTFIEIPESGHLPPMEQPQLFADVFEKLR